MNLAISLRSELLKTRRTATFYFTLVGAAVVPFIFLLNALVDTDGIDATRKNPLNGIFKLNGEMNGQVIFPWFVILACTLLPQIEYRNHTWKQLLATPQSKLSIFLAKFFSIQGLMILFLVANHLFMWIAIFFISFVKPELDLFRIPLDGYNVLRQTTNAYLVVLGLSAVQFWMGLRFRNFIVPVAVGLVLWLTGTLLVMEYHSKLGDWFPYAYHVFPFSSQLRSKLDAAVASSAGYALFFLALGLLDFRRRRMGA